jgi:hypothetical protein
MNNTTTTTIIQFNSIQFNSLGLAVFTAVTIKNAVFWNVTPCFSCMNRRFGERIASIIKKKESAM